MSDRPSDPTRDPIGGTPTQPRAPHHLSTRDVLTPTPSTPHAPPAAASAGTPAARHDGAPSAAAPADASAASGVSRRRALQVLGLAAAGAAGAAGGRMTAPDAPAAGATGAAGTGAATAASAGTFFTARERALVDVLVDYVIPRDARSGSATDAGVPAWMDAFLSDADTDDGFRAGIRGGLAWLDAESVKRHGATFVAASDAQRRAILDDIAYPKRARPEMSHGVAFFNRFRDFTASGFFSSRIGHEDLQYTGNVAVAQWNGCPPEALDRLGVSYALMDARPTAARSTT